MEHIKALFEAISTPADPATICKAALAAVEAAGRTGDIDDRSELIDAALEAARLLFDTGFAVEGAELYASVMRLLAVIDEDDNFELARRLDDMAGCLVAAGLPAAAQKALEGAIAVTEADADADDQAFCSRLQRLADLQRKLGNETAVDATLTRLEARLRKDKSRELSADGGIGTPRPPHEAHAPQIPPLPSLDDALAKVPKSDGYTAVPIHFATHRKPTAQGALAVIQDPYTAYGYEHSEAMNFGYGIVTVPKNRAKGYFLETDGNEDPAVSYGKGGKSDKCFTVHTLYALPTQEALQSRVREALGTDKKEMLVYVHGFNNSLASALMRAAQLKADMKIDGAAVVYSFPSKGSRWPKAFVHDHNETMKPELHRQFAEFLKGLCENTGAEKIHLVGHSLGCNVLVRTLDHMAHADGKSPRKRFDEVIFAAPAVEASNFRGTLKNCVPLSRRTTVYASSGDMILKWLGKASGLSITGHNASSLSGIDHVDVVDTRAERSWFQSFRAKWGHVDFADQGIDDMRGIVWFSLKPAGRRRLIGPVPREGTPTHWAVKAENQTDLRIYSEALIYSRTLDLDAARLQFDSAVRTEENKDVGPNSLEWYRTLLDEVQNFIANRVVDITEAN